MRSCGAICVAFFKLSTPFTPDAADTTNGGPPLSTFGSVSSGFGVVQLGVQAVAHLFAVSGAHEQVGLVHVSGAMPLSKIKQTKRKRAAAAAAAAAVSYCSLAIMDQGMRSTGLAFSECFTGGPSNKGSPAASCPAPVFQCV